MHKSPVQNGALITTIIGRLGPSPAERVDRVTCLNSHHQCLWYVQGTV